MDKEENDRTYHSENNDGIIMSHFCYLTTVSFHIISGNTTRITSITMPLISMIFPTVEWLDFYLLHPVWQASSVLSFDRFLHSIVHTIHNVYQMEII